MNMEQFLAEEKSNDSVKHVCTVSAEDVLITKKSKKSNIALERRTFLETVDVKSSF